MQDDIFDLFSTEEIYFRISKYIDIQDDIIEHSKYYYNIVKNKLKYTEDQRNIFIVCVCLSVKYLIDEAVYNTFYCDIFKIKLKDFNRLELLILKKLKYRLKIDEKYVDGHFKKCILI